MTVATALRVEIGPDKDGTKLGDDWVTCGIGAVDHKCTWGQQPLPFEDNTVDELYASHVIEHIPWFLTDDALAEAFRVLRPGGLIELHTIDFAKLVMSYNLKSSLDQWTCHGLNDGHPMKWLASRLFAYGRTHADVNWHKAVFDHPYLVECLEKAGFTAMLPAIEPRGSEKHGVVNFGVTGRKP